MKNWNTATKEWNVIIFNSRIERVGLEVPCGVSNYCTGTLIFLQQTSVVKFNFRVNHSRIPIFSFAEKAEKEGKLLPKCLNIIAANL